MNSRWRLSICLNNNQVVGVLWSDIHKPMAGHIEQELIFFMAVIQIMQLILDNVTHITTEADSTLNQVLLNPQKSDCTVRFKVRKLHAFIQEFEQVQFLILHPGIVRFSKVLSRNSAATHVN